MKIIAQNPLYFAFLFPSMVDCLVTLLGQDNNYWQTQIVNEASPAYYFLKFSPYFFILGSVAWFIFWYFLFLKLKTNLKLFLSLLFISAHSWGSSTWLWKFARDNQIYNKFNQLSVILVWSFVVLYFALIAYFAAYCYQIFIKQIKSTHEN